MRILIEEHQYPVVKVKDILHGIDALENFFKENNIPMSLSELNIDETHFKAMADHACEGGRLENAFVPLDSDDVVAIYKDCL